MQAASYYATTSAPPKLSTADPVRSSVTHLLTRAHGLPCSAAAQAFAQLIQPAARFQVALDNLLPLLSGNADTPRRILASYILYGLYAAHPIVINPFRSEFINVFLRERDVAKHEAQQGGVSETEQLVWVLWKILKGDGNDLGPYSPANLAKSPLPPKLRASHLTIEDIPFNGEDSDVYADSPTSNGSERLSFVTNTSQGSSGVSSPTENPIHRSSSYNDAKEEFIAQGMHCLHAARSRILTLTEQRVVIMALPHFTASTFVKSHALPALISLNPNLGHPVVVSLLKTLPDNTTNYQSRIAYLDVLRQLPPTLPSFDILGRLLRDPTPIAEITMQGHTTVADLVRTEVLGAFVQNCISWVEQSDRDAQEGLVSDDRAIKAVQNLCRFYNSLIKLDIIDPASDADTAEMAHFALTHARLEEANALYRVLVMGKF